MGYLEISKIGVDVLLMLSLMYLAWRFSKQRPTQAEGRVTQLEESLRGLVREAEDASRSLEDRLLRRQQGLEKLLREMEAAEAKVHRTLKGADEKKGELEGEIHKAALVLRSSARTAPHRRMEPLEPAFEEAHYSHSAAAPAYNDAQDNLTMRESARMRSHPRSAQRDPARAPEQRSALAQSVEKVIYDHSYEEPLQDVVSKADQLSAISVEPQRSAFAKLGETKERLHSMRAGEPEYGEVYEPNNMESGNQSWRGQPSRSAVERWESSVGRAAATEEMQAGMRESAVDPRLGVLGAMRKQASPL